MSETKTKNLCTVPAADLTDSQYFIAEDGGELKRIPKAQVVLKKLEKMLATDTENLAGGGEVTAQELLDALAEQVANKLLAKSQVVNNLLATVEGNPLDATQGKALKELIDTTNNNLSNRWTLYGAEIIPNNADMYTYTEPGNYACATNAVAATLKNCPLSTAFDLKVYRSAGGKTDGYIIQEYTAHDAKQRVLVPYDPYTSGTKWGNPITFVTKDDLVGHTIYVAGKGGTQNFNIGNNGFLFIPYTSITFGIYYLGTDSAKLILGTEDSDFKVSISGTTCMLQNNKGWNIFCVFITGQ